MAQQPLHRRSAARDLRVARTVFNQPWVIAEAKLHEIAAVVRRHRAGVRMSDEDIRAAIGASSEMPQPTRANAIAVIPVYGVLAYRMDMMTAVSGGTSLQSLSKIINQAMDDSMVGTIVLRFETPGGSVDGMTEMATQMRAWRDLKPIIGSVDVRALSGGYWLASQCTEICCTPSGAVGSIGVVVEHCDDSEAQRMEGEIVELISVPEKKAQSMEHGPLSDEHRARLLEIMGQVYGTFVADVAKGRKTTPARVKSDYGGGDVLTATEAKAAGMVDRIETFDATLVRLARGERRGAGMWAQFHSDQAIDAMNAEADKVVTLLPAIPGHAHIIGTDGQPMCGCAYAAKPKKSDMVEPNEDGECPDGYEKGEDGMCHLMPEDMPESKAEAAGAELAEPQPAEPAQPVAEDAAAADAEGVIAVRMSE